MKRLLGLAKPETGLIVFGILSLFISSASSLAMPYFFGQLIETVAQSESEARLSELTLILFVTMAMWEKKNFEHENWVFTLDNIMNLGFSGSFFAFIRGTVFTLAGERVVARYDRSLLLSRC